MPRYERIGLIVLAVALALWALIFVLWLNAPYVAVLYYP